MNLAYVSVAVASSLVNRLGISNRPKRTGILSFQTILIWPEVLIPGSATCPYNCFVPGNGPLVFWLSGIKLNDSLHVGDGLDFIAAWDPNQTPLEIGLVR